MPPLRTVTKLPVRHEHVDDSDNGQKERLEALWGKEVEKVIYGRGKYWVEKKKQDKKPDD